MAASGYLVAGRVSWDGTLGSVWSSLGILFFLSPSTKSVSHLGQCLESLGHQLWCLTKFFPL